MWKIKLIKQNDDNYYFYKYHNRISFSCLYIAGVLKKDKKTKNNQWKIIRRNWETLGISIARLIKIVELK